MDTKLKKPIEPRWADYPTPKEPNGKNHLGEPLFTKVDWIAAKNRYDKELAKYEADIKVYEQKKLIKLVKNASEKYCLQSLEITKK